MASVLSEDLNNIILEEINIIHDNTNVSRVGLEVDSFKGLNKPLCSMSKLFDRGYEGHLSHGVSQKFKAPEGFTGLFNPSNGEKIPLFREADGLWYVYYVAASNSTEARKLIKQGKIRKIMWDTGATASIVGLDHEDMIDDKRPSRMICRGAFDTVGNRAKSHGILKMWAINDPSKKTIRAKSYKLIQVSNIVDELEKCKETFVGISLAELMRDQLVKDECPVTGGVKNKLSGRIKKMTALEFHCYHNHIGYHPDCRICNLTARSLKRTYVDRVIYHEIRTGYRFTMDAVVISHRSDRGRKYAYTYIDMGPSGYFEGFTLVLRSDLCSQFFPKVKEMRSKFQKDHNHPIFRELLVDCAGEHVSEAFKKGCIDYEIDLQYGSTRKQSMGLVEATMKHRELGMKNGMLERNLLTHEWEQALDAHEWLTVRYPQVKNIKSHDGDAPSRLEIMSNGRYSRDMIRAELKNYVPPGQLCHVKLPEHKGSNIGHIVRSRIAVSVAMMGNTVKWMDIETKARFRSNDYTFINYGPAIPWQEFVGQKVDVPALAMPRAIDRKIIQDMRTVNVHEIGSNTREHKEMTDMKFDADEEEIDEEATTGNGLVGAQTGKSLEEWRNDHKNWQGSDQFKDKNDKSDTDNIAAEKVIYADAGDDPNLEGISELQQRELETLHSSPRYFINHEVLKIYEYTDKKVAYTGIVYDVDDDGKGNTLWGIQWSDGSKSDFDMVEMRKYCVLRSCGYPDQGKWIVEDASDVKAVTSRLDKLKLQYYVTKNNDSWPKICNAMRIEYNQRKLFYQWLSEQHGYGLISPKQSDSFKDPAIETPPWMKFYDPYSTYHPKTRQHNKFRKGIPFPYPVGGAWNELVILGQDKEENPNQAPKILESQIHMLESMQRRLNKVHEDIDRRYEERVDDVLSMLVENESATRKLAKKAMEKICGSSRGNKAINRAVNARVYAAQIIAERVASVAEENDGRPDDGGDPVNEEEVFDIESCADEEFAMNVMLELAEQNKFSEERLKEFAKAKPPANFEEAMKRPDAKLYELATAIELSAFDKYDIIEHNVSQSVLCVRGLKGNKVIPLRLIYEVKINDDGSYCKHKCRCILLGHKGFLTAGLEFDDTYAPTPEHFSNMFLQAYALMENWFRDGFDISTAYLQSDEKFNECGTIVMGYPRGFGGTGPDGKPMRAIMKKPIYGHPSAARAWSKTVTEWTEEFFMSNGWTVGVNNTDPCVFVILSPDNTYNIMWIHTDDCFVRGERNSDLDYIRNSFGNRFGIKRVDPRYMLGILSELTQQQDGSWELELTQPEFVEQMLREFGQYCPSKPYATPFKPSKVLGCKEEGYDPSEAEQQKYHEMGYRRLVGMLLWCSRRCYNEILFGVNQCCAVMSKPSEEAWNECIHIVTWLRDNYKTGIKFSSNGNRIPKIFYDSSHNQFTADSKSTYGVTVILADGPVGAESKRHPELGDSTPYSEYMAAYHASKRGVSTYQFIYELDDVSRKKKLPLKFAHMIEQPIILYGDNDVATQISQERRTQPRSRHWLLKFHALREYITKKLVATMRVPSPDNVGDGYTKSLDYGSWKDVGMRSKGYGPIYPYENKGKL